MLVYAARRIPGATSQMAGKKPINSMEASVNKKARAVVSIVVLAGLGVGAAANMPGPPPTPSASLGIEVDVKPNEGTPGQFVSFTREGKLVSKQRVSVNLAV